MKRLIQVAVFRPRQEPIFGSLANKLPDLKALVGGFIEVVPISEDLILVCNEDGKRLELDLNRYLVGPGGIDPLVGTFFVCRRDREEFDSIAAEDRTRLSEWHPLYFWNIAKGIVITNRQSAG